MNDLFIPLGWVYLLVALFFLLGLLKPFAHFFYPKMPSGRVRAAAPVLFAILAASCFASVGFYAFLVALVAGMTQITVSRYLHRKHKQSG